MLLLDYKNNKRLHNMSFQAGFKHFPFKEVELKTDTSFSLKGLRIVQLSDLHLDKKVDINYVKQLVQKINDIDPDLVVFTGDILQTRANNIKEHIKAFKALHVRAYYVSGNHDVIYGLKELKNLMEHADITCLDNSISTLHVAGGTLQLVGLSDRYSFARGIKRPIKELFAKLDKNLPTILLAHQPKDIQHIKDNKIDIQLSGHTHGGQIYPLNLLVKFFQPYFSGLYTDKKTLLYVTNGLGYWGIKIRYKAPSEIPIFTIN